MNSLYSQGARSRWDSDFLLTGGQMRPTSYESVDELQNFLAEKVFSYTQDKKKAAGRALGTLVEVIAFYLLKAWQLNRYVAIEQQLSEYSNGDITHNVEYSLHPSFPYAEIDLPGSDLPITSTKVIKEMVKRGIKIEGLEKKKNDLLTSECVLRNGCVVLEDTDSMYIATMKKPGRKLSNVSIHRLLKMPYAMVECKRVGVEEGNRKGPQTIEKAKQGAYVARAVSSLTFSQKTGQFET